MLKFGLGVTTLECCVVCPVLAIQTLTALRLAGDLRDRLHAEASRDPLTGLLNRRGFDEAVAGLARGGPMAVLVCDIDHFKRVNDRLGHDAGDLVLRAAADVLRGLAEELPAALLARFGGEEFVVALPGDNLDNARAAADKARQRLAAETQGPVAVTASFGVASAARFDGDMSALIARADAALYRAKEDGRNRVVVDLSRAVAA
jgi:diguanylate cyclase (GGDEF)-like protein